MNARVHTTYVLRTTLNGVEWADSARSANFPDLERDYDTAVARLGKKNVGIVRITETEIDLEGDGPGDSENPDDGLLVVGQLSLGTLRWSSSFDWLLKELKPGNYPLIIKYPGGRP